MLLHCGALPLMGKIGLMLGFIGLHYIMSYAVTWRGVAPFGYKS